jgi:CheY-like chemotaxis protein/HPt (histidine-containing phosphotransfer) domain-containing protein
VLLSSIGRDDRVRQAEGEVLVAAITKPVRSSRLLEAVSLALDPAAAVQYKAPPASVAQREPIDGHRILVVDDNEVNRRLVGHLLDRFGYEVVAVADGRQALDALRAGGFAAVLMDLEMPVMDGYTAIAAIRRGEAGPPDVPLIAVSAAAMVQDQRRALASGADAHVAKPIDRDELREVLASALGRENNEQRARNKDARVAIGPVSLDASVIGRLREIDGTGAVFRRLVGTFFGLADERLLDMRRACETEDVVAMKRLAHDVRGAAANLGMVEVAAVCSRLESEVSDEAVERLARAIADVRGELLA